MTRETKIGLLVGLAFVIVIGILISDHISSNNEPGGAPLRAAAENLRSSLGQSADDVAPPLRVPARVAPQQPVPTADEINRHNVPPVHFVDQGATNPTPTPQPNSGGGNTIDHLRDLARQNGEELVAPTKPTNTNQPGNNQANGNQPPQPRALARSYLAQAGDSLGAIAFKAYGSSCKSNRDLIASANPALADNCDLIVVGKTYVIPPLKGAPEAAGTSPATIETHREPIKPAQATATYVVKSRDTLWSIATSQVGSSSAVGAIRELNQDVLNGSDHVRPNMKLKLPARLEVSRSE